MGGARETPRRSELLALPSAVLEAIAAQLDLKTRAALLPLVCKSFRHLLSGPNSSLWRNITFEADISQAPQRERAFNFLEWLRRHGQHSKSLELDLRNGNNPAPQAFDLAYTTLEIALENALAEALRSCEFLRLRWGGAALVVDDWVRRATALTCLVLGGHDVFVKGCLSHLRCLAHMELSTVHDHGPFLESGCLPPSLTRLCCVPCPAQDLAEGVDDDGMLVGGPGSKLPEAVLALPRLAYLDVSESMFGGDHLAAALPRLTRLTSLAFDRCELPDGLPCEVSLLTRLRVLSFDCCFLTGSAQDLTPPWTALTCLSRLVSLSLSNSHLTALPPPLTGMTSLQHLYLEHNLLRVLPPGPYWAGLRVLATDWEPLLRSHTLLGQAPHLRKLALGSLCAGTHDEEGLPPLASASSLLSTLRSHPALREVLLVARAGHTGAAVSVVLEALLSLRGLRPTLEVRPVDHETFFVEEPPPAEEEEAAQLGPPLGQQEHARLQQAQQAGPQLDGGEGPLVAAVAGGAGAASA